MEKKYFDTKKGSVEEKINTIASEQPTINATYTPDVKLSTEKKYFETKPGSLADAASKIVSEALDPVNKDAVKKKFDDRKDKDIDNDGDTDSTDKYLHKKRKAISKATSEDKDPCWKDYEMIGTKKKDGKEVPNCVPKEEKEVEEACWDGYKQVGMKDKGGRQVPNCVPDKDNKIPKQKKQSEDTKKSFEQLRTETKLVRLGEKGKTATGKKAAVVDLEPRANPI